MTPAGWPERGAQTADRRALGIVHVLLLLLLYLLLPARSPPVHSWTGSGAVLFVWRALTKSVWRCDGGWVCCLSRGAVKGDVRLWPFVYVRGHCWIIRTHPSTHARVFFFHGNNQSPYSFNYQQRWWLNAVRYFHDRNCLIKCYTIIHIILASVVFTHCFNYTIS